MPLFLHKYLFSWHLLPLTFIQSPSLINFPKYILDIHPLLFKTIALPYSKILEPLNWPFPSTLPLPLLSPLIYFTLHSEWHFHNTHLKTPQWLPLSHAYESYSWSLTLSTGLCLFFQPRYIPFASLFTIFPAMLIFFKFLSQDLCTSNSSDRNALSLHLLPYFIQVPSYIYFS